MSVIFFGSNELGKIAAARSLRGYSPNDRRNLLQETCEQLAEVSKANAQAFNATYSDGVEPYTAQELAAQALIFIKESPFPGRLTPKQLVDAFSVLTLLDYNCTSNDGQDFLLENVKGLHGLMTILNAFMRDYRDTIENSIKRQEKESRAVN